MSERVCKKQELIDQIEVDGLIGPWLLKGELLWQVGTTASG